MRTALETIHLPGGRTIRRGDAVADDDPALDGRGHLFGAQWAPVEQTTAAPGEVRNSRRGHKPEGG